MNKRNGIIVGVLSVFFLALIIVPLASAYYLPNVRDGLDRVIQSLVNIFEPILYALFGGFGTSAEFLFEKFLLFILLVVLIFIATKNISALADQKTVRWVIALIIPLIAMRWINTIWLNQIITNYAILGIVITAVIPFILYFYFLYTFLEDFSVVRKMGWVIFIGVYLGLWSSIDTQLSSNIYLWTVVASVICLIFDTYIFKKFRYIQLNRADKTHIQKELANNADEISRINKQITTGTMPQKIGEKIIKDLMAQRKMLMKI